jgi:hypothetical protein
VHGLRRVDDIRGLNQAIPSESSSLAGWPLVVVNLDSHSRKGFPFGLVLEVVNDYPEVIKDQASAINLSLVDSRIILELKHISHNRFYCLTVLVDCQHLNLIFFLVGPHLLDVPAITVVTLTALNADICFCIANDTGANDSVIERPVVRLTLHHGKGLEVDSIVRLPEHRKRFVCISHNW